LPIILEKDIKNWTGQT